LSNNIKADDSSANKSSTGQTPPIMINEIITTTINSPRKEEKAENVQEYFSLTV
jgi:hypothetical protein